MQSKIHPRAVALFALVVLAACGSEPQAGGEGSEAAIGPAPTTSVGAAPAPSLDVAAEIGLRNARMPLPGLVTGGQPSEAQLQALREAGYTNFVSLRPASEDGAGWEEAHAIEGDYGFARLPIAGGASLTRENVEVFAEIMAAVGDEPTVLYCASGNRVGAMLALKAYWIDGASAEDALSLGLEGGMTRLEPAVRELLGL